MGKGLFMRQNIVYSVSFHAHLFRFLSSALLLCCSDGMAQSRFLQAIWEIPLPSLDIRLALPIFPSLCPRPG